MWEGISSNFKTADFDTLLLKTQQEILLALISDVHMSAV